MVETPRVRQVFNGCLVVTIEEHGHTHHYQQHNEILDGRVGLESQQYTQNQYRNGLGRLSKDLDTCTQYETVNSVLYSTA